MDIKCKNCGQMIDENDKYCKYCGYLIPQKEVKVPLSKIALDDKIQECKATICDEDIDTSKWWDLNDLSVKMSGNRQSLYAKIVMYTILCILLGVSFLIVAFLSKFYIENNLVAFICLFTFMLAMIVCFGFGLERYYNTKGLKDLKADEVVVKKYGFKKPAEILIDGNVFELIIDKQCPICEGEIIGDLHIERIERKLVVVCNINRKHIYQIDEKAFVEAVKEGIIKISNSKKDKTKQD